MPGKSREKCYKYWPQLNGTVDYSGLRVSTVAEDTAWSSHVTHRTFSLTSTDIRSSVQVIVQQYQLSKWSEKAVPDSPRPLMDFVTKLLAVGISSPMLVHCSDGSGRTGSFIAIFKALTGDDDDNLRDIVFQLREDRAQMASIVLICMYLFRQGYSAQPQCPEVGEVGLCADVAVFSTSVLCSAADPRTHGL